MKLVSFFALSIFLNAYFDAACGFEIVKKMFNILMEPARPGKKFPKYWKMLISVCVFI